MNKGRIIVSLALLLCTFASLLSASIAWFAAVVHIEGEGEFSGASIVAYFADGDGTERDPYIIAEAHHLYNLAWLQNSGVFSDKKYYFKVCNLDGSPKNLNMAGEISGTQTSSGAIPPIGTKENPFIGEFDGAGSTISNLWVSTLRSDWKEQPEGAGDYESEYVGLFGAILYRLRSSLTSVRQVSLVTLCSRVLWHST